MMNAYQHLFGPVPSRRLGLSLGVDLTAFKTCSLDGVFCQLGRTAVMAGETAVEYGKGPAAEAIHQV